MSMEFLGFGLRELLAILLSGRGIHTVPLSVTCKPWARASQPTMVAISCTSCLVSLAFVDWERRRLSFARRQGCVETWTLEGREEDAIVTTGRKKTAVCNVVW
jgi:hypothetical protein